MRHTSARRLRALGSAALVGLAMAALPGPAAAENRSASSSLTAQVAALNADIDRVGAELAEGAVAYEAAAQDLVRLTQQQFAAGADHDALQGATADSRSVLAGLARSAYKGGLPPTVKALLPGDPRALSSLAYVRKSVNRLGASRGEFARDLGEQQAGAGRALAQSDTLRRAALVKRQALDGQLQALAARTDQLGPGRRPVRWRADFRCRAAPVDAGECPAVRLGPSGQGSAGR